MDGSYLAVVLLCVVYAERQLAGRLYAARRQEAKDSEMSDILRRAREDGLTDDSQWHHLVTLAALRDSLAYFNPALTEGALDYRAAQATELPRVVLARDATGHRRRRAAVVLT